MLFYFPGYYPGLANVCVGNDVAHFLEFLCDVCQRAKAIFNEFFFLISFVEVNNILEAGVETYCERQYKLYHFSIQLVVTGDVENRFVANLRAQIWTEA